MSQQQQMCAICQEILDGESSNIQIKKCLHAFHKDCMELFRASTIGDEIQFYCPNCRIQIQNEDLRKQEPLNQIFVQVQLKQSEQLIELNLEKNIQYFYDYLYAFDNTIYEQDLVINDKQYSLAKDGKTQLQQLKLENFCKVKVCKKQNGCFNLFVRLVFNETIKVEVQNNMSIRQLCQLISIKAGTDPEHYRYTYISKQFDFNTQGCVSDYPFQENSTIHQLQRLKGGQQKSQQSY